jgi:hypothetical protein
VLGFVPEGELAVSVHREGTHPWRTRRRLSSVVVKQLDGTIVEERPAASFGPPATRRQLAYLRKLRRQFGLPMDGLGALTKAEARAGIQRLVARKRKRESGR